MGLGVNVADALSVDDEEGEALGVGDKEAIYVAVNDGTRT